MCHPHLQPEFFVHSTSNDAALKEKHCSPVVAFCHLKIEVVVPVLQLVLVQGFGVEVWAFNLPTHDKHHRA